MAFNHDTPADSATAPTAPSSFAAPSPLTRCRNCNCDLLGHAAAPISNLCPKCHREKVLLQDPQSPDPVARSCMDAADPGLDLRDVVASASATPLKEVIKESHESMKANDRDETEVSTPPESVNSALNRSPHCGHISKEKNLSLRISADLKTAQPSTQHERIGTLPSPIIPSPLQLPPHEGDGLSTSTTMMLPPRQAANRCMVCQKRVGLVGFKCRCGDLFCATHRYSDRHDCSFDYKAAGRKAIAKENPVVKASKIEKI